MNRTKNPFVLAKIPLLVNTENQDLQAANRQSLGAFGLKGIMFDLHSSIIA